MTDRRKPAFGDTLLKHFLARYSDVAFAAMRMVLAFLYLCHGIQKLTGALAGQPVPLASLLGVAGVLLAALGSLIAIGLLTSWAAFIASGEMAAADFIAHFPLIRSFALRRSQTAVA